MNLILKEPRTWKWYVYPYTSAHSVQDEKNSIKMLISNDFVIWRLFDVGDYRYKYDVREEDYYLKDQFQDCSK